MTRRGIAWALVASWLFPQVSAASDSGDARGPGTVVVLTSNESDDVTMEATSRVEGELRAAGFRVAMIRGGAEAEVETAGGELHPIAAFAIAVRRDERGMLAEIEVCDRLRQRTVMERARIPPAEHARESAVLAVRAVELLKASLAEFGLTPPSEQVAPASTTPADDVAGAPAMDAPPPPRRPFGAGIGFGAGLGVVAGPANVGTVWLPSLIASFGTDGGLAFRFEFHGLGPAVQVNAPDGSATVAPRLGTVGVTKTWWPRWRAVPFVSAAIGVQEVHVAGSASAPYRGLTSDMWSFFTNAGVGLAVPIVGGLSIVAESRAAVAWPPAAVAIAGREVGQVGAPSWLGDANLFGVFP